MCKADLTCMMTMRSVGSAHTSVKVPCGYSSTKSIQNKMSTPARAEILSSKGSSCAAAQYSIQDVDSISNVIVPGYTTPVASSKCVVQDETDIPVALSPVLKGVRAGARITDKSGSATKPYTALQAGG